MAGGKQVLYCKHVGGVWESFGMAPERLGVVWNGPTAIPNGSTAIPNDPQTLGGHSKRPPNAKSICFPYVFVNHVKSGVCCKRLCFPYVLGIWKTQINLEKPKWLKKLCFPYVFDNFHEDDVDGFRLS